MNKTSKKEIAESIADLSMSIAKSIYGDKPNQCIVCHQLISHPEKIEKRAEKPLKIILL